MRVPYAFILGPLAASSDLERRLAQSRLCQCYFDKLPASGLAGPVSRDLATGYGIVNAPTDSREIVRDLTIGSDLLVCLAGGEIAGVVGAIISVSVIATFRIL